MLNEVGLVIPTHCSHKGKLNWQNAPPNTGWIIRTLNALYEKCPDARNINTTIVLNTKPTKESNKYHQNILDIVASDFPYIKVRCDNSPGFRGVRLNMCKWFKKDYLFLLEHDWEFKKEIDLVTLVQAFEDHDDVNYIRFNKRANVITPKLTATGRTGGDLYLIKHQYSSTPLLATPQYSNNPHIERMSAYRNWCDVVRANPVFAGKNGGAGGFEHPLQEKSLDHMEEHGIAERNRMWGTYIYGKIGDAPVVEHFGV